MAQKSKNWPILAKIEVAPSIHIWGMVLIKWKIESGGKIVLMYDFFILASDKGSMWKLGSYQYYKCHFYKIAQFLAPPISEFTK